MSGWATGRRLGTEHVKISTLAKLSAASSLAALAMVSAPALAQDTTDDTAAQADAGDVILVTGSRIQQRPELQSVVPVTNFGGDQIYRQSTPNIGEALNDLPSLRSTYSQ